MRTYSYTLDSFQKTPLQTNLIEFNRTFAGIGFAEQVYRQQTSGDN